MAEKKVLTEKMVDHRAEKIRDLDAQIKELEGKKKSFENEIKEYMETMDLKEIKTLKNTITYTMIERTTLDTKALKEKDPKLYAKFSKETSYRRFLIKEVK